MTFDQNGNIVVADTGSHRIQVFQLDGAVIRNFGTKGVGDGEFRAPIGVAIDRNGNIIVVDEENHNIQIVKPHATHTPHFHS